MLRWPPSREQKLPLLFRVKEESPLAADDFSSHHDKMGEPERNSSQIGYEMANLMEEAVAKKRKKNEKLRMKLSKANSKLKKQVAAQGSVSEDGDCDESEDPNDPNSGWFKKGELAIILDHMEHSLQKLVGNGKSAQYKKDREKAWQKLLDEINALNESEKTGKRCNYMKIKKKIDNLLKNGNSLLHLQMLKVTKSETEAQTPYKLCHKFVHLVADFNKTHVDMVQRV